MTIPLFFIPIIVGLLTQFSKRFFNHRIYSETITIAGRHLPRYGGMPSAHASFAASLATTVAVIDGISSASFAIAAAILFMIFDDALRLRMILGRYGMSISKLVKGLPEGEREDFPHIEQRLGHTGPEVLVGTLFGFVGTLLLLLIWR